MAEQSSRWTKLASERKQSREKGLQSISSIQTDISESEEARGAQELNVRYDGRLRRYRRSWQKITSDIKILSWISGYRIVFSSNPVQLYVLSEPKWSSKEMHAIKISLNLLLKIGVIKECNERSNDQFLSNISLVPKPDGSQRMILNLKSLNNFLVTNHFKIEDHRSVSRIITQNCFMATIDLKDAYFLIPIESSYRKFLRFRFNKILYEFNCMPFGLCVAPLVFTKLMKPVVSHLRSRGLLSVLYLDDFLLFGDSYEKCLMNINTTCKLLEDLGFIINKKKSSLIPRQTCKYLGFNYNSVSMTISLPCDKRIKILQLKKKKK